MSTAPPDPRVARRPAPDAVPAAIWRLDLADERPGDERTALLDDDERARLARLAEPLRRRTVVRRALLAAVAAAELGVAADEVHLSTVDGRRVVRASDGRSVHVSSTQRADEALVAVAARPVGIDLELADTEVPEALDIAATLLHPDEAAWIGSGPAAVERFLRIWVRKEAVVKLTGEGLARDLRSFVVRPDEPAVEPVGGADDLVGASTVALVVPGLVAAVAWRSAEVS